MNKLGLHDIHRDGRDLRGEGWASLRVEIATSESKYSRTKFIDTYANEVRVGHAEHCGTLLEALRDVDREVLVRST